MRPRYDECSDEQLLAATTSEPNAFGEFYRRTYTGILAYARGRGLPREVAADLCAEVFAVALEQADRYDPHRGPPRAWLLSIAQSRLIDSFRRGRVEDGARRRLGMPDLVLTDEDLERVDALVDEQTVQETRELLAALPAEQREAVVARVVEEKGYGDIAAELRCSEAVVRKRVSRGLATLRTRLRTADD